MVGLKWPNDLLFEGRKLGGILIESRPLDDACFYFAIGFGLNVFMNATELAEIPQPATSLAQIAVAEVDRTQVLMASIDMIIRSIRAFDHKAVQDLIGDAGVFGEPSNVIHIAAEEFCGSVNCHDTLTCTRDICGADFCANSAENTRCLRSCRNAKRRSWIERSNIIPPLPWFPYEGPPCAGCVVTAAHLNRSPALMNAQISRTQNRPSPLPPLTRRASAYRRRSVSSISLSNWLRISPGKQRNAARTMRSMRGDGFAPAPGVMWTWRESPASLLRSRGAAGVAWTRRPEPPCPSH